MEDGDDCPRDTVARYLKRSLMEHKLATSGHCPPVPLWQLVRIPFSVTTQRVRYITG